MITIEKDKKQRSTIAMLGGKGFIGGCITEELGGKYKIIHLTRNDIIQTGAHLREKLNRADIIINLAGEPIIKRWTWKNRKRIYSSRVCTTTTLVEHMNFEEGRRKLLINASAVGIYDHQGRHTEKSKSFSKGFMRELILDWEGAAIRARESNNSVVILRFGLVIGRDGGMIKRLLPIFRMGLGGVLGTGEQYMSFVHCEDVAGIIDFLIDRNYQGVVNVVTKDPVKNYEFTKILSEKIKQKAALRVPEFLIRALYGKGAEAILGSAFVIPGVLNELEYKYKYENMEAVLDSILKV